MKQISMYLTVLLFVLVSCDNSIYPFNEEKGLYSIYGYLDLYEDVNHIRVKDLNKTLIQDTINAIDAEVTFKNLKKGATQVLEDTVVKFDGVKTHNFFTTMGINPNTEYQVSVKTSDEKAITATTTTPYIADTHVHPMGANCTTQVQINFEPVRSQFALRVELGFYYKQKLFWLRAHNYKYENENGVNIFFTPYKLLNDRFEESLVCEELSDDLIDVRYTHYGPDLYGTAVSDVFEIPGGVGRFGAYYNDTFSFPIDTLSLCPPYCP